MIKTHKITGLKYLCKKVTDSDSRAISYKGSGTRWNNHLKIHGKDIYTEILEKFPLEKIEDFSKLCLEYSKQFNIVKSKEWANLIDETGKPGTKIGVYCGKNGTFYGKKHTLETRKKISDANKGDNNVMRRNPSILQKMIYTKNKPENIEKARLRAIEINSRLDVKEKNRQSKTGINNIRSDKNIYRLKNIISGDILEGTRFQIRDKMNELENKNLKKLSLDDIGYFFRKTKNIKTVKGWIKL
jgi:hypothetical protein